MDLVAAVGGREWLFSLADAGSQVVVDFTHPDVVMDHIRFCLDQNIHVIAGTSGIHRRAAGHHRGSGSPPSPNSACMVVPNFAIGAVLTARFAREAARFFESVEIIELHHAGKADAPSGTAVATARAVGAGPQGRRPAAPCRMPPPWRPTAPAAPPSTASGCTRCGCPAWSRTRRSSWAARGRR